MKNSVWLVNCQEKRNCPAVKCSTCKRNLNKLEKGDTRYNANWMEQVEKVSLKNML